MLLMTLLVGVGTYAVRTKLVNIEAENHMVWLFELRGKWK